MSDDYGLTVIEMSFRNVTVRRARLAPFAWLVRCAQSRCRAASPSEKVALVIPSSQSGDRLSPNVIVVVDQPRCKRIGRAARKIGQTPLGK